MDVIKKQSGFTLFEMAIALVIVGLLMAFAAVGFSGILRSGYEKKTFSDMEIVADAISMYAQRHMRIPCPADPTKIVFGDESTTEDAGVERGSNSNAFDFGTCTTNADQVGALPYVTLGLPKRYAYDRFGNLLTYRVSETSALAPVTAVARQINQWCMTRPNWLRDADNDGNDEYMSLAKAAFCCGTFGASGPAEDVAINGPFGEFTDISRAAAGSGGAGAEYIDPATLTAPAITDLIGTQPPVFPAYVIVSHGQNGFGAYGSGGVRATAGLNAEELENADDDRRFFTSDRLSGFVPSGSGGTDLFRDNIDDIVFWETPAQILGRLGGVSCSRP